MSSTPWTNCPLCSADRPSTYARHPFTTLRCGVCGLVYQPGSGVPDPSREGYFSNALRRVDPEVFYEARRKSYRRVLRRGVAIAREHGLSMTNLLDIGCDTGAMLDEAAALGIQTTGFEVSPAGREATRRHRVISKAEELESARGTFSCLVFMDVIEHLTVSEALRWLEFLAPSGLVIISTPHVGGLPSRLLRSRWLHYHVEHVAYYSPHSLARLLSGRQITLVKTGRSIKQVPIGYGFALFQQYQPDRRMSRILRAVEAWVPKGLREATVPWPTGFLAFGVRNSTHDVRSP